MPQLPGNIKELMDTWKQIADLSRDGMDTVVITITAVRGSVPGELGGKAVVTATGLVTGNLGGGKVEAMAVRRATEFLEGSDRCATVTWNLQRDVGMTCGGEMSFLFEKITANSPWHLVIFGAGHVSQALVPVLATLCCRIDVIDTRAEWLGKFQSFPNVKFHRVELIEEGVSRVEANSYVLSITMGHSCDRPVVERVLRLFPEIPFLGVIGSSSKRAVLLRELREEGLEESVLDRIICPLGLPIGGNDPAEIAISISAQLLSLRK